METNNNNNNTVNAHMCAFDNIKMDCLSSITTLLETYKQNDFALRKIHRFCTEMLANSITISIQQNTEREEKMNMVREKSETFITNFLDTYPQYYYFQNNTFVKYDGETFSFSSEDQISNRVVIMLSMDADLSCRKHKIKTTVVKRIRDRGTSLAVPSSQTIQNILKPLYPSIFETRNETKYFLTIIGDVLNKKPSELNYFVHKRVKEFIDYIVSGLTFLRQHSASNLSNTFKYKFQNHSFANSRVLRIQGSGNSLYYPNLNIIDLFFVAQYYSNRYGSADEMLQQVSFSAIANHSLILKRYENEKNIVEWFANETILPNISLQSTSADQNANANANDNTNNANETDILTNIQTQIFSSSVDTKTVKFMWKRFCQKNKIPNVIQNNTLINTILTIEKYALAFDQNSKKFIGYTGNCFYNPSVSLFMEFWDNTITMSNKQNVGDGVHNSTNINNSINDNVEHLHEFDHDNKIEFDDNYEFNQLEIDEVAILFNSWIRKKGLQSSRNSMHILEEEDILACIKHFYANIDIENEKYVNGVVCSLWNKYKDVYDFIENSVCENLMNETHATSTSSTNLTKTSDNLYRTYCQTMLRTNICIASKGYFEKVYNSIY